MALGTDNMQSASLYHTLVILLALLDLRLQEFVLFGLAHIGDIFLDGLFLLGTLVLVMIWHLANIIDVLGMFAQNTVEVALGVAAQQDIGTTTGHIGSNRHGAATPGLRHNLGLFFVMLGVEDIVWNALFLK